MGLGLVREYYLWFIINKRIVLRTVGAEAMFVNAHPQPQRTFFKNIFLGIITKMKYQVQKFKYGTV